MLTIRPEQFKILSGDRMVRYADELYTYTATEYPEQFQEMGEDGTREFIRETIAFGAKHGLVTPGAVGVLVELKLDFGRNFELSPDREWAHKILTHPALPGEVKVTSIRNRFEASTDGRKIVRRPVVR